MRKHPSNNKISLPSNDGELTDDELEIVRGGMSFRVLQEYRAEILNHYMIISAYSREDSFGKKSK